MGDGSRIGLTERIRNSIPQWIVILSIFTLFMGEAVISYLTNSLTVPARAWVILVLSLICTAGLCVYLYRNKDAGERILFRPGNIDVWLVLIIILTFAVRLPMIGTTQRVDGGIYYGSIIRAAETFEFSFVRIWKTFRLAGHTSIAFTLFALLGEFLTPGTPSGVNLVCDVMTAAAMGCLYRITRELIPDIPGRTAFILVGVIQFTPLFWGTYSYIHLDYMYLIFFIYMWYTHIKREYVLTALWTLCVVMTKETGGIILFGYYIVYLTGLFASGRGIGIRDRFMKVLRDPITPVLMMGAALVILYFVKQGALSIWAPASDAVIEDYSWFIGGDRVSAYGQDAASFGIYPKYMICKFIHFFILGFNWIASCVFAACCVVSIRRGRIGRELLLRLAPALGAMTAFALFNMIYITWCHARYIVFFSVMWWFVTALFMYDTIIGPCVTDCTGEKLTKRMTAFGICSGVCSILLAAQTFAFIDPVSNLIFDHLDTGRGDMLYTSMRVHFFGDQVVSSYRYTYMDGLLDDMLEAADYGDDMQIVEWNGYVDQSELDICGKKYRYGWDKERSRRVVLTERLKENKPDHIYELDMLNDDEFREGSASATAERLLMAFHPYAGQDRDECMSPYLEDYEIEKEDRLYNWGGCLDYYVLRAK